MKNKELLEYIEELESESFEGWSECYQWLSNRL